MLNWGINYSNFTDLGLLYYRKLASEIYKRLKNLH